jgi:carbon-monoxide dehydrogenase medium subunit
MLKQGLIRPDRLVSLHRIGEMRDVGHQPGDGTTIGALVTLRDAERSDVIRAHVPVLAKTYAQVANPRIRGFATVGGNLAEADYASDPPPVLMALRASVTVASSDGRREIAIGDFFTGFYETALATGEIVTAITIPDLPPGTGASYQRYLTRSREDRPCVGVAVVVIGRKGVCEELRVVVGAVAEIPQEFPAVEETAAGARLDREMADAVGQAYAEAIDPIEDLRGSAAYRQQMVGVFVRRAIEEAVHGIAG